MANIISFNLSGITEALVNEYVRVTDTSRVELFSGNALNSDAQGNVLLNIGESGTAGQEVIVKYDNYDGTNLTEFTGAHGGTLLIGQAGTYKYLFDGTATSYLQSPVTLTVPYSIKFGINTTTTSNGAVLGSTVDSTDLMVRSDGRIRISNNTTTATFDGVVTDGVSRDVEILVLGTGKAQLWLDGVQSGSDVTFSGDFVFDVVGSEDTANRYSGFLYDIEAGGYKWAINDTSSAVQDSDPSGNSLTIGNYNEDNWVFEAAPEASTMYVWLQSGQSLACGVTDSSNVIVNTGTLADAYLFNNSPARSLGSTVGVEADFESLTSYIEDAVETNGYGALSKIIELLDDGGSWLFANHARGGASIDDLSPPGSTEYDNGVLQINNMVDASAILSKTVKVPFINWVQGESNWQMDPETYITKLRALHDNYIAEVNSVTAQADLPMMIELTGKSLSHDIACALFEYTQRYSDAFCSLPKYFLNRMYYSANDDRTHLSPSGYIIQGEYEAIAGAKLINDGVSKCLEPIGFTINGNTIEVQLNVPSLPLVIDEITLPSCPSYGLKYIKADTTEILPTVTISGDTLILDIGEAPQVGDTVDCGVTLSDSGNYNGAQHGCTNIRDSSGTASAVAGWTLNHWLVEFKHELE